LKKVPLNSRSLIELLGLEIKGTSRSAQLTGRQ